MKKADEERAQDQRKREQEENKGETQKQEENQRSKEVCGGSSATRSRGTGEEERERERERDRPRRRPKHPRTRESIWEGRTRQQDQDCNGWGGGPRNSRNANEASEGPTELRREDSETHSEREDMIKRECEKGMIHTTQKRTGAWQTDKRMAR